MEYQIRHFLLQAKNSILYAWAHCKAWRHGVNLLPLPKYWDRLSELDWELMSIPDPRDGDLHRLRLECRKYFPLQDMAEFSICHEEIFSDFILYAEGFGPRPLRPD